MKPATAIGHVAGKLASVLYGLLKRGMPYDDATHRQALRLPPPAQAAAPDMSEHPIGSSSCIAGSLT